MSTISEQNQRKHCSVCSNRLDRVKSWNAVQKENLIVKLNYLKDGIRSGDLVCGKCSDKARRMAKKRT